MKKWALDPVAWISAVLLFGLLTALGIAFAALSPWLGELFRMSPRLAMLAMLVWLAGVYETAKVQGRLERDAAETVGDVRTTFTRNVQSL